MLSSPYPNQPPVVPLHPQTQVDGLNEARAEQLNRVKITEKEVEALEGAKAEAEALQVGGYGCLYVGVCV